MLRSRSIFVDIRGATMHMNVRHGCPQWGVLSPLLWNMVADSLLNQLGNCNCFVQGFADDIVILINGKFLSTMCDLMQNALNCVQNCCGEIGLNVNADKKSMVLFTKRKNLEGFFAPRLFDTELVLNNQVKYLGGKLNWKFHIDNRIRRASVLTLMPYGNRKIMGSETEGGVLDIHFGNKTDVDLCRISLVEKNTSDHCKNSLVISSGLLAWE
jgi:hypothetical protein